MKMRKLGNIEVSAVGMGCTFYDTAEIYATFRNEELVGKALKPIRNEIVLATKYSPAPLMGQHDIEGVKLSRNGVRKALGDSLRRLQTDHVDIYCLMERYSFGETPRC